MNVVNSQENVMKFKLAHNSLTDIYMVSIIQTLSSDSTLSISLVNSINVEYVIGSSKYRYICEQLANAPTQTDC